ncbi:MAG: toll/interleukin-1 receptor domain-containing protein [Terracidiphilus sp.]
MAHDVFISHSAKDKVTADAVCAMLESEGVRCWIAPRDVLPSMEWSEAIIDAIEECRIMVLVFTANANDSPQIRREVERAVNHGVAILPVRIEDVLPGKGLEYFIGNVHWLDALKPPLDTHLRNLAGTVKIVLARAERLTVPQAPQPGAPGPAPSAESPRLAESRPAAGATEIPHIPQPAVIGKPLEQPEGSGTRNLGEWQSGGGAVAAAPPRRIPVWAWGGGILLALLLVAVFAAVHFTSHSAPVGSPQAAPEPVQGSPLTGGPGGAAPAASPSPTPAPRQGVTRTAEPSGAVPAAPAATTPATPEAAAGRSPSLENTMETLRNELSSIGTVNFTVFGRNTANGIAGQYAAAQQFSNVVANPTQCRVSYHWTVWRNGAAQPVIDKDAWFLLRDVTSVVVEPQSQFVTQNNAASGQPNIVATSTAPAITTLVVHTPSWVNPLTFTDSGSAYRAAKTVTEAVRLCGGTLAN